MSFYELLIFLHIAAAIIWLGAGFLLSFLVLGAERAGDPEKMGAYHRDAGWLAPRLFIPASLSTLIFGILLVIDGSWSLGELWILIALAGWAISSVLGLFYFKPEGERIGALMEQHGPGHGEVEGRVRRLNIVDRIQVTILFLVVADMVIKPTGDDGGVLVGGIVILGAAAALGLATNRRRPAPSAAP